MHCRGFNGVLYNLLPLVAIKNSGAWLPSRLTFAKCLIGLPSASATWQVSSWCLGEAGWPRYATRPTRQVLHGWMPSWSIGPWQGLAYLLADWLAKKVPRGAFKYPSSHSLSLHRPTLPLHCIHYTLPGGTLATTRQVTLY